MTWSPLSTQHKEGVVVMAQNAVSKQWVQPDEINSPGKGYIHLNAVNNVDSSSDIL